MIAILVSSKSMTMDGAVPAGVPSLSEPDFAEEAHALNERLAKLDVGGLRTMMKISRALAESTRSRILAFPAAKVVEPERAACLVFSGDVYDGLAAGGWQRSDFKFAQKHLRILSGLYGMLRPLDSIRPYRLEPGYRWQPGAGATSLPDFWRERVTRHLVEALRSLPPRERIVVDLASREFASMIDFSELRVPVVTPHFQEVKDGVRKTVALFTKRARGAMARWIVINRLRHPDDLKSFAEDRYRFAPELSDGENLTFSR